MSTSKCLGLAQRLVQAEAEYETAQSREAAILDRYHHRWLEFEALPDDHRTPEVEARQDEIDLERELARADTRDAANEVGRLQDEISFQASFITRELVHAVADDGTTRKAAKPVTRVGASKAAPRKDVSGLQRAPGHRLASLLHLLLGRRRFVRLFGQTVSDVYVEWMEAAAAGDSRELRLLRWRTPLVLVVVVAARSLQWLAREARAVSDVFKSAGD